MKTRGQPVYRPTAAGARAPLLRVPYIRVVEVRRLGGHWEDSLAALLGVHQVDEHRGHALPTPHGGRVGRIVKVVVVCLVLLPEVVPQDLEPLAVGLRSVVAQVAIESGASHFRFKI